MRGGALIRRRTRRGLGSISLVVAMLAALLIAAPGASGAQFSSTTAIKMPDGENFLPYPSVIAVSGQQGAVTGVRVTLNQIAHGSVDEVNALLVSPTGASALLMDGGCNGQDTGMAPLTLTFDDAAPTSLPATGPCASGAYRPTADFDPPFPYPAPPQPHPTSLSALTGASPNGVWQLFLRDSVVFVSGEVRGGWSLDLSLTQAKTKAKKCKKPKGKRAASAKKKRCKKKKTK